MEPTKFDELTKALATATSRRQALKTIAATTIGGILGLASIGSAFAKPTCKPSGHGCGSNKQCCSGVCDQTTIKCACPPGTTELCNGTCATNCLSTGCSTGCNCVQDAAVGNFYCAQGAATQGCSSDCDCPNGQMCINGGVCVAVC